MALTASATVTRGPASWAFIYIALGFAISIEGTAISLITPLRFPWNLILYAVIGAATFWTFINNGEFQNGLLSWKDEYEQKAR
jgi:energy-coupling factor transporter transmembrane protein EcfT